MYLKTLKVVGFKSFADRTRLEFRPGVSVVVGPNGSGKSNLVDAIHWVMGTQAPKSLRTQKMEDVIFAGTATRPALNRSEVTVVFDNASRMLPLDLDEVSVTRRLYRDGSSDYEINGVDCRLLDVQELLADSGVGRHQHIIVNQGQVDSVLNAGPDEHRAIIEEAAGILKHKLRKERALRRLERTDEDVLRLSDVLGEITRQMRPLKRQAEAAERHLSVVRQVHDLTLFIGGEDLRSLDSRLSEARSEEAGLSTRSEAAQRDIGELAIELRRLTTEASVLGETLDRDGAAAARLETTLERLRRVAQVAQERHRTRKARLEGADERRKDLHEELQSLQAELEEAALAETQAGSMAVQHEQRFRLLEDEERSMTDQENLSAEGALAVVQGDLLSLGAGDQRDRRELEALSQRLAVVGEQRTAETAERIRLGDEIRALDTEVGIAQVTYENLAAARRSDQESWEAAEVAHTEKRLEVAAAQARLEALIAAAEGFGDPEARRIVEETPGVLGSVTALLDVPGELAAAVDAALGAWAGAVAFTDDENLAEAVGRLKASGRGGVPIVGQARAGAEVARAVASATGLEALVDRLGPRADSSLARGLLGDVVIAEGWAAGWAVVHRHPQVRAVTPEGDLISVAGIKVSHPDGATPAMVEAAAIEVDRAERELARVVSRFTTVRREFDQSRQAERAALEGLESIEAKLAGATEALGRSNRTAADLEAELGRLDERRLALTTAITDRQGQISRLTATIAALEGEEAQRQRLLDEWSGRRRKVADDREAARASWQQAASQVSAAAERRALIETRCQVVTDEIGVDHRRPVSPGSLERLALIEDLARTAIEAIKVHVDAIRDRQDQGRRQARSVGEALAKVRQDHENRQSEVESHRSRLSSLAVEQAEARVRREAVVEALRREIDASEEAALAAPPPMIEDGASLHELLAIRQAELRRMGPVNPLAAEEYRELSERHLFMTAQLTDLENSRAELRKVMKALDEEIQVQFLAAFEEVAAAYQEHFVVLFPGGKGRIRLTDPDQPLTSGVEIEAQPLGKKVGKLSLLSGGERSLAALAFMFGVFKARPSPFYILDEVEAALDDANLRRFLRLVEAFRGASQLVLITHQQQTMEAADVLYGVTVEPGGSSQVIAKHLIPVST
jgi:chromosome segregation protein